MGVSWPLSDDTDDAGLDVALYADAVLAFAASRAGLDADAGDSATATWEWRGRLNLVLRQDYRAGEQGFVELRGRVGRRSRTGGRAHVDATIGGRG